MFKINRKTRDVFTIGTYYQHHTSENKYKIIKVTDTHVYLAWRRDGGIHNNTYPKGGILKYTWAGYVSRRIYIPISEDEIDPLLKAYKFEGDV